MVPDDWQDLLLLIVHTTIHIVQSLLVQPASSGSDLEAALLCGGKQLRSPAADHQTNASNKQSRHHHIFVRAHAAVGYISQHYTVEQRCKALN